MQGKVTDGNNKLIVQMKDNHAATQRITELQELLTKYEQDLTQATDIGDEEAKVGSSGVL